MAQWNGTDVVLLPSWVCKRNSTHKVVHKNCIQKQWAVAPWSGKGIVLLPSWVCKKYNTHNSLLKETHTHKHKHRCSVGQTQFSASHIDAFSANNPLHATYSTRCKQRVSSTLHRTDRWPWCNNTVSVLASQTQDQYGQSLHIALPLFPSIGTHLRVKCACIIPQSTTSLKLMLKIPPQPLLYKLHTALYTSTLHITMNLPTHGRCTPIQTLPSCTHNLPRAVPLGPYSRSISSLNCMT